MKKQLRTQTKTDDAELMQVMNTLSDKEIIALAAELEQPVETTSDNKLKNRNQTIEHLVKGGCYGCGKSKKSGS